MLNELVEYKYIVKLNVHCVMGFLFYCSYSYISRKRGKRERKKSREMWLGTEENSLILEDSRRFHLHSSSSLFFPSKKLGCGRNTQSVNKIYTCVHFS